MLGLGGDAPTHRAAGHEAVLALLRRVAEEAPLLVVLDDAHWADRASVEALAFVARRVQGSRIGLLAAFRPGVDDVFGWRLLPRREVPPLPEAVAAALLADRHPELERGAARQVLHEAAGNPLALLELPAALSTQGRRTDPTPAAPVLPLTRRLQALYSDEVEQLPAASRDVLLVARWRAQATSRCRCGPSRGGRRCTTWPRPSAPVWSAWTTPPSGSTSGTR
jgi:hypothetical protein